MKKLMIAAAAAAMIGGAYAACEIEETQEGAVYDIKVSLKTLGPKTMKATKVKGECGIEEIDGCTYLDNATRSFGGLAYLTCGWDCNEDEIFGNEGSTNGESRIFIWDNQKKWGFLVEGDFAGYRYSKNAKKVALQAELACTANVAYRTKDEDGEWSTETEEVEANFAMVGFGTWDAKKQAIKSVSGGVIGDVTPCVCSAVTYSLLCDEDATTCGTEELDDTVPGYGTWSIKYNSSKSKAYTNGKKSIKSYVKYAYVEAAADEGDETGKKTDEETGN